MGPQRCKERAGRARKAVGALFKTRCHAVVDNLIQTQNTSEKDVVALLTGAGLQEEAAARNKWHRATLSRVQLSSYFTGYTEIVALRNEVRQRKDSTFSVKNFNEQYLSFGSAPVKYICDLLLRR